VKHLTSAIQNRGAAWGTAVEDQTYLSDCLNDIKKVATEYDCTWIKARNLTKAEMKQCGTPHKIMLYSDTELAQGEYPHPPTNLVPEVTVFSEFTFNK
jgi:hypothetical protein